MTAGDPEASPLLTTALGALVSERAAAAFGRPGLVVELDVPADRSFGDLTANAFHLARVLGEAPPRLAEKLAAALAGQGPIVEARAVKGFVNLRLAPEALMAGVLGPILADPEGYGRGAARAGRRLMVEFSAPNTNKPQHLGHMRNAFLGDALSRVLANAGATVIRANLYNDRGIQICKSMVAYRRWGGGRTPESAGIKGDHFVGEFYVLFETRFREERDAWIAGRPAHFEEWKARHGTRKGKVLPEDELAAAYRAWFREDGFGLVPLGRECQEMLLAWEAGTPDVLELWRTMNGWALAGFAETYRRLGVAFDAVYRESETYALGREQVLKGVEQGTFTRRADGAIEIDLEKEKLGRKVLLRSDGTSIYITQDIGTTIMKAEQHGLDGQIWVVAEEQKHHFQVLFKVLEKMGFAWAADLHHLAYGLVHLPEGRMKSREGKVVDADDLLDEVEALARREIEARDPQREVPPDEVARRARAIALSSLRFMLLKVAPLTTMTFYPEESVKLDGDTGARVLYAFARLSSMLGDAGPAAGGAFDAALLSHPAERELALDLLGLPGVAARAAREHNPSLVANYLIDVVRNLNRFYDACDVLRAADPGLRAARLALCRAAAAVLRRGGDLLGMPLLERM